MERAAAVATMARPAATMAGSPVAAGRLVRLARSPRIALRYRTPIAHSGGISANVWPSCMPWLRR